MLTERVGSETNAAISKKADVHIFHVDRYIKHYINHQVT